MNVREDMYICKEPLIQTISKNLHNPSTSIILPRLRDNPSLSVLSKTLFLEDYVLVFSFFVGFTPSTFPSVNTVIPSPGPSSYSLSLPKLLTPCSSRKTSVNDSHTFYLPHPVFLFVPLFNPTMLSH